MSCLLIALSLIGLVLASASNRNYEPLANSIYASEQNALLVEDRAASGSWLMKALLRDQNVIPLPIVGRFLTEGKIVEAFLLAMHLQAFDVATLILPMVADPNCPIASGGTLLIFIVEHKQVALAESLIERGAAVNLSAPFDRTPLSVAVRNDDLLMTAMLLSKGATADIQFYNGITLLHWAVRCDSVKTAKYILNAKFVMVNATGDCKFTPLHDTVSMAKTDMMKLLLTNGADIDSRDAAGRTPLQRALCLGYFKAAKVLIDAGAQIVGVCEADATKYFGSMCTNIHGTDRMGRTALHHMAKLGRANVFEFLLKYLAPQVNAKDYWGWTPLHLAARFNNLKIVQLLMDAGADPEAVDKWGTTPLVIATRKGHADVVRALSPKIQSYNEMHA